LYSTSSETACNALPLSDEFPVMRYRFPVSSHTSTLISVKLALS